MAAPSTTSEPRMLEPVSLKASTICFMQGTFASTMSSGRMTAKGSLPTISLAMRTAWPRPRGSGWRVKTILASLETERAISSSAVLFLAARVASSSKDLSKWSSMVVLPRPVTMMISVQPAATASSTPYWMRGLSTRTEHLLGRGFGGGEEASAESGGGEDCFADFLSHDSFDAVWMWKC